MPFSLLGLTTKHFRLFRRARFLFSVMSTGTRDTMELGKGVMVLEVVLRVLGSFWLGSGEFVGLTANKRI